MAELTSFVVLLAFAAVNASAIRLFGMIAAASWARRIVLGIALPGVALVASLGLAANTGLRAAVFGLALLGMGTLVDQIRSYVARKAK